MPAQLQVTTHFRCFILAGLLSALWGCGGSSGGEAAPVNTALSGSISIETGTRVDADNADTLASGSPPFSGAQRLPGEFILAGYASASSGHYLDGNGLRGNAFPADPVDTFSLTLRPGQSVSLQPFSSSQNPPPVNLSLLSGNRVLASKSTGGQSAPVRVSLPDTEAKGPYTLNVEVSGREPVLYILSTSMTNIASAKGFHWPDHDFAGSEAIVVLRRENGPVSMRAAVSQGYMEPEMQLAPDVWLVKAPPQAARSNGLPTKAATLEWIHSLNDHPEVVSATPNYTMRTMAATPVNEPLYNNLTAGQQWHYELLNAPTAWQLASDGGAGVTVAVMDTGLYGAPGSWHSELNPNVVQPLPENTDFVSEAFDNDGVPGRDNNPSDPGNSVGTSVYHGTHVAGTVAAAVNGAGGAGIAYGTSLLPVRILGEGGTGSSADLLAALNWVSGRSDGAAPRADIVNLSLGGLPYQEELLRAINDGIDQGILYVAAAGNSASTSPSYPAAYETVFSVSAVDGAGALASYSNSGSWIDLAAPGGDASRDGNADGRSDLISSTSASVINGTLQETYIGLQGTSMAAPHVSAVFALMKSLNPALKHDDMNRLLMAGDLTRQDCGRDLCPKNSELGWGLLDAGKSTLAASTAVVPNLLQASPAIVSLSSEGPTTATVRLTVYGSSVDDVTIESVSVNASWIKLDSVPAVNSRGKEFAVTLSLLPEELEAGVSARAPVVVEYRSDKFRRLEIPVVGQRVTDQQARDAGRHFVLLVDPEPEGDLYTTVAQTSTVAENGQYRFSFLPDDGVEPKKLNEVPPGQYILVAGTDLDNDGLICHVGEACAEYPVAGLREKITVPENGSVTNVRLTTSYSRPTISAATPEMLPRPGFIGYRLLEPESASGSTAKKIGVEP